MFGYDENDDDEDIQYSNALILLKNDMKEMDEFAFFKKKIEILKSKNRELLVYSVSQLPQSKKDFFMNILSI